MNLFDAFSVGHVQPVPVELETQLEVDESSYSNGPQIVLMGTANNGQRSEYLEFDIRFNAEKQDISDN